MSSAIASDATEFQSTVGRLAQLETAMSEILRDVLQVTEVKPDDDFFSLGGTSLGVLKLVAQISDRFGIQVSMDIVAGGATPSSLAATLAERLYPNTVEVSL